VIADLVQTYVNLLVAHMKAVNAAK